MKYHFPTPKRTTAWFIAVLTAASSLQAAMVIDSLSGPVTQNEIDSFKTTMAGRTMGSDNFANKWVYGANGTDMEALGQLYEITGDREILDRMIQYADKVLSIRNNPTTGRIMWTGKREPVWPNESTGDSCAGAEQGDVLGHAAYCAKLILLTPSIWNTSVGVGDPNGYGSTYKARAQRYVTELDKTLDQYLTPYFVDAGDSNHYRFPDDSRYTAYTNNSPIPWNQQAMLSNGYQNMADCHEILKDSPSKVSLFRDIVGSNMSWFLSDLHPYTDSNKTVYDWGYSLGRTSEDCGHGGYDMLGLCRTYTSGLFSVSATQMTNFANTLYNVIWDSSLSKFHARVDGTDGADSPTNTVHYGFIGLSRYLTNPDVYTVVATQNRSYSLSRPMDWACIMTEKHRRDLMSAGTFFYRHYRLVAQHSGKVVEVTAGSTADGANVEQWSWGGGTHQQWTLNKLPGSAYYQILNRKSRKAMNVSGASTADGGNVIQWSFGGSSPNDQWAVQSLGSGLYRLTNRHSGKVLDVAGNSTSDGANVDQWTSNGGLNQQFQLISVP